MGQMSTSTSGSEDGNGEAVAVAGAPGGVVQGMAHLSSAFAGGSEPAAFAAVVLEVPLGDVELAPR